MCFSWQTNGLGARFICLFYENEIQVILTAKNGQKQRQNLHKNCCFITIVQKFKNKMSQSDLLRSQLSGDTSFLNVYFTKLMYFRKEAVTIQVYLFLGFWLIFLQSCLSIFISSSSYLLRNQCLHRGKLGVCKRRVKDSDICQVCSGSRC